jgi:hypothetical protein
MPTSNLLLLPLLKRVEYAAFWWPFGIDVAVYDRKSSDDIVTVPISTSSGYNYAILNAGELSNKGIELLIEGSPIKGKEF